MHSITGTQFINLKGSKDKESCFIESCLKNNFYFSLAPSILQLENPGSIHFVNQKLNETIIEQNFNSFVKISSGKTTVIVRNDL